MGYETRPPTYTTQKNKPKMDKRLKCKFQNHKNPRRKLSKIAGIMCSNVFANIASRERETKEKMNK